VKKGEKSAFPQARLVALAECGTHAIFDFEVGPYTTTVVALAEDLIGRLQPRARVRPAVHHDPGPAGGLRDRAGRGLHAALGDRVRPRRAQDPPTRISHRAAVEVPDLVKQEIWGHQCCHYAIQSLMGEAASHSGHDPDRVSFVAALRITRQSVAHQGAFPPDDHTDAELPQP
jgi:hypothetical protein